jgi:prepilin-type N-terminal cleavage/methylation domain-containing protein
VRLASERGFTLIEVLMAACLLAVGVVVLIGTFDYSRKLVTTAEANEVAVHKGHGEVERLMALPYPKIALASTPAQSGNPNHPNYYVQGSSYRWDQGSTGPQSDPLVVDSANSAVGPQSSTWTDGQSRLSGSIYRFVTTVAGTNGKAKRITVAVTVAGSSLKKPVLVSSIVTDPTAAP